MKSFKIAVFVSGRGSNLQALLDAQHKGEMPAEIAVVISDKKDAYGLQRAEQQGITNFFVDPKSYNDKKTFEDDLIKIVQEHQCQLVALAGFMRILSAHFLVKVGCPVVNIHPSLLPAFPGLDAQRQALEYGVKYSGCTVHFVDEGVDSGPIIAQAIVPVYSKDTIETLAERILLEEHKTYPKAISYLAQGMIDFEGRRVIVTEEKGSEMNG